MKVIFAISPPGLSPPSYPKASKDRKGSEKAKSIFSLNPSNMKASRQKQRTLAQRRGKMLELIVIARALQ